MKQINLLADENEQIKESHFADQIEMTFSGRGQQMKISRLKWNHWEDQSLSPAD